jgi:hypothetical protein
VILSSVRTLRPGFLNSLPRMNVALTRCKKGMVIVTHEGFLEGAGRNTLLGQLSRALSQCSNAWINWKAMLNNDSKLPGLPAASPPGTPSHAVTTPRMTMTMTVRGQSEVDVEAPRLRTAAGPLVPLAGEPSGPRRRTASPHHGALPANAMARELDADFPSLAPLGTSLSECLRAPSARQAQAQARTRGRDRGTPLGTR